MKEHFYQTGMKVSKKLLEPAYSIAVDSDLFNSQKQIHLAMGMKRGIDLFFSLDSSDSSNSNRIIFITDACPTVGRADSLDVLIKDANSGQYSIFSTFIGVGLDYNTKIVEELTKVRGCNYFSVKSTQDFKKILNEEFNYIVTPIAYNVNTMKIMKLKKVLELTWQKSQLVKL